MARNKSPKTDTRSRGGKISIRKSRPPKLVRLGSSKFLRVATIITAFIAALANGLAKFVSGTSKEQNFPLGDPSLWLFIGFVTSVLLALTAVLQLWAAAASDERLTAEQRYAIQDFTTKWKSRIDLLVEPHEDNWTNQIIKIKRDQILEAAAECLRQIGLSEPRVCLYRLSAGEKESPNGRDVYETQENQSTKKIDGTLTYVAHYPAQAMTRPTQAFSSSENEAPELFESLERLIATKQDPRKGYKIGNRWQAAIRVPISGSSQMRV